MAAVRGIDDYMPTATLAVALVTREEIQCRDGLEDEMEENASRVKLTRCSRKKRDISMYVCMCNWAQVLEDEHLSNPTSMTAKQFRTDCRLPCYPFFLKLVNQLKVTPLHRTSPGKTQKLHIRFDGRQEG